MDQTTYFVLAWIASSLSALAASANLFVVLRDRSAKIEIHLTSVLGADQKSYIGLEPDITTKLPEALRLAIAITNLKSTHVMIMGAKFKGRRIWSPENNVSQLIDGTSWPVVLKSGATHYFEISGKAYASLKKGHFVFMTNRGRYRMRYVKIFK